MSTAETNPGASKKEGRLQGWWGKERSLVRTVIYVLAGGLLAGVALWLAIGWIVYGQGLWDIQYVTDRGQLPRLEATRTVLTILAGVGGAIALVVAYRWQGIRERDEARHEREEEQNKREERRSQYVTAVGQLGGSDPTTRLAGVYALANLADEYEPMRQQCIDVLCARLRLPWDPDSDDGPTVSSRSVERSSGTSSDIETITFVSSYGERELRETILRVFADHLHSPAIEFDSKPIGGPWSDCNFDLTGAVLPAVKWWFVVLRGSFIVQGATFTGEAGFGYATFGHSTRFGGATFRDGAWFESATFGDGAWFEGAAFGDGACFECATFGSQTRFEGVAFGDHARFTSADFGDHTLFGPATFGEGALFTYATFGDYTWFGGAFYGSATFGAHASFDGVSFGKHARFDGTSFGDDAGFEGATFRGQAAFKGATQGGQPFNPLTSGADDRK